MNETELKKSIDDAVKLLANGGHVLLKMKDVMLVVEKNNVNPKRNYVTHEVTYHPHQDKFTI